MNLKAIKYSRFKGKTNEWSIEGRPVNGVHNQWLTFTNINLIVGKNATGKSKMIGVIRQIADLLSGKVKVSNLFFDTGVYYLAFEDGGQKIDYHLNFKNGRVIQEILKIDGKEKLNREKKILFYMQVNDYLAIEIEDDILAVSRIDNKQQPFFESLYLWGKNLNFYAFGKEMGRGNFIKSINAIKKEEDTDLLTGESNVPQVFILGKLKFEHFAEMIIEDMNCIGYQIKEIDAKKINLKNIGVNIVGISAQEADIESITDQTEMSQGMFRALSLLIQLNYSLLNKIPSCILIDDIGEGLDYDRCKNLIDLIIHKVKNSEIQVIMTTNDRFVMNKIPLAYWSVIQRVSKKSLFYNYRNSKEIFDEFKYTGLNNFDFLATEFYLTGFESQNNPQMV